MDFDPIAVSRLSEKKITAPGSPASSLLSELKLRAIIENARQMCKVGPISLFSCSSATFVLLFLCQREKTRYVEDNYLINIFHELMKIFEFTN